MIKFTPKRARWLGSVVLLAAVGTVGTSGAQSGGDFEIIKSTESSGGGVVAGGVFSVTGAVGQADAGIASGGVFEVYGGLFAPLGDSPDRIFSNGFE